ncbi:MAG: CoA-binding protein [Pyrinomonadaceae bacterium]
MKINSEGTFTRIFKECRTIGVVGLSSNSLRPSNGVAAFMQEKGYRIIPVNPFESEVLDEKCYSNLESVPEKIDLVDIFRNSEFAGEAVDEAIKIGAKAVWLQEGVVDVEAAARALDAGLLVVMDKCWLKEYYRYGN